MVYGASAHEGREGFATLRQAGVARAEVEKRKTARKRNAGPKGVSEGGQRRAWSGIGRGRRRWANTSNEKGEPTDRMAARGMEGLGREASVHQAYERAREGHRAIMTVRAYARAAMRRTSRAGGEDGEGAICAAGALAANKYPKTLNLQ